MKKLILLFALMFSVSSAFISCRETEEEGEEMEMEMEEAGDEMEDEVEDLDAEEEGL